MFHWVLKGGVKGLKELALNITFSVLSIGEFQMTRHPFPPMLGQVRWLGTSHGGLEEACDWCEHCPSFARGTADTLTAPLLWLHKQAVPTQSVRQLGDTLLSGTAILGLIDGLF